MIKDCPKCQRPGLEPVYHKVDDDKCLEGKFNNTAIYEHLHYKCKCGYDFIENIYKEGDD